MSGIDIDTITDKFTVDLGGYWGYPTYWINFLDHCHRIARVNQWHLETVINWQLKPHGRLITPKTSNAYLRWSDAKYHTLFVMRWA